MHGFAFLKMLRTNLKPIASLVLIYSHLQLLRWVYPGDTKSELYMVLDQGINNLEVNSDIYINVIQYTKCSHGKTRVRNRLNRMRKSPRMLLKSTDI